MPARCLCVCLETAGTVSCGNAGEEKKRKRKGEQDLRLEHRSKGSMPSGAESKYSELGEHHPRSPFLPTPPNAMKHTVWAQSTVCLPGHVTWL